MPQMVLHFVIVASWTGLWRPPHACGPENDPWAWHEMEVKIWWGLRSTNGLLILRIWKILKVSYVIYVQFGYSTLTHALLKRCKCCGYFKPSRAVLQWIIQCSVLGVPKLGFQIWSKNPSLLRLFFWKIHWKIPQTRNDFARPWLRFQSPIPKKMCCPSSTDAMDAMDVLLKLKSWSQEKVQQTFHNTWICLPFHCWP